jgi:lysophospholipase L1-like esterase
MAVNLKVNKYKSVTIWTLSIILLISVLLNVALYRQLMRYYRLLYAAELDPLGLSYFQSQAIDPSTELPRIVFFGDSRAEQWITPTLDGFTFINRGIGNQTTAQVANRFDAHVKPLKPQIIVVQVGINDLKTIPLFPEREQEIVSNCTVNIQKIVQDSLSINATVILTTIVPASGKVPLARKLVWSDEIYTAINEVNVYIRGLAADNVIVFDTAGILANADGRMKPEYSYDLLHLNSDGYAVLNLKLVSILESLK